MTLGDLFVYILSWVGVSPFLSHLFWIKLICSRPPIRDTLNASDRKVRDLLLDVNMRERTFGFSNGWTMYTGLESVSYTLMETKSVLRSV